MDAYKKCLLDILFWFHSYCGLHNLRYYLVEGTMLGAARHKGMIPWDDDIDVGMPRRDYEELKKRMGDSVHDGKYMLETEDSLRQEYIFPFGKIYDVTTRMVERKRIPVEMGVYIDIFPLDGIGETKQDAYKNFKRIGFLQDVLTLRTMAIRQGRKWYKKCAVKLVQGLPGCIVNDKQLAKEITQLCKIRPFDSSAVVGNLVSAYRAKELMPREIYGEPQLYVFEGRNVYGVEDYDGYLTYLYGDWKKLPPEDKRGSTHTTEQIDLHTAFIPQNEESGNP